MEKVRLLLVDDNEQFLEASKLYLEQLNKNFQIIPVLSAKGALQTLSQECVDVIVSDYDMPEIDGLAFYKKLKELKLNIPFIIFTGKSREEVAIKALNLGVDFFLQKGSDTKSQFRELVNIVEKLVKNKEMESALIDRERFLSDIFSSIQDGICVIDKNFTILRANSSLKKWFSSDGEIIGKKCYDYFEHKCDYCDSCPSLLTLKKKQSYSSTFPQKNSQGSIIQWFSLSTHPFFDSQTNEMKGVIMYVRNISSERLANERIKREREIFKAIATTAVNAKSVKELSTRVLSILINIYDFDHGEFFLCDQKNQLLKHVVSMLYKEKDARNLANDISIDNENYLFTHVYRTRKPIFAPNVKKNDFLEKYQESLKQFNVQSLIAWPIINAKEELLGSIHLASTKIKPILQEDKVFFETIIRMLTTALTKLKIADSLQESEERYRLLFNKGNDGKFLFPIKENNELGNFLAVNDIVCDWLNYSKEELLALSPSALLRINDQEKAERILSHLQNEHNVLFEAELLTKNGLKVPVEINANLFTWQERSFVICQARNLSDRKEMELAFLETEKKYRWFVKNFKGIAYCGKMDWTPIFFHGAIKEITGYNVDVLLTGNPHWMEIVHPEDKSKLLESGKKIVTIPNFSQKREYRIIKKDGEIRWVHEIIQNICDENNHPRLIQSAIYDITDRKRVEQQLSETEEILRTFVEQSQAGIAIIKGNRCIFANEALADICGYSVEEILSWNINEIMQFIHKDDQQMVYSKLQLDKQQKNPRPFDIRFLDREHKIKWVTLSSKKFKLANQWVIGFVVVDITLRKKAEMILRETSRKYHLLLEGLPDHIGLVIISEEEKIVFANSSTLKIFKANSLEELTTIHPEELVAEKDSKRLYEYYHMCLSNKSIPQRYRATLRRLNGECFPAELSSKCINYQGKAAIQQVVRDISEQKRVKDKLLEKQQLLKKQRDELEAFASTVAHDIRNKLQVISLYNSEPTSEKKTKIIDEQIKEMSGFLDNLLILAKKGEIIGELSEVNLNQVLPNIIEKISPLNPHLELEVGCLPIIKGDQIKLIQVFENILLNIVKHAQATKVTIDSKEDENHQIIIIQDNGQGFSSKDFQRLYNSLTTKRYTSFGLIIVIKIIQAHNGHIVLESRPGEGTSISILLPK